MSKKKAIPNIIDESNNVDLKLIKEQYLGKGAFGRCYALRCSKTGKVYAGKFLHKHEIKSYNMTSKIIQEINIHKSLNHENIVGFENCIEDKTFIYIILELCSNRSMSELIRRRKCILTFEAKYYMKQVVSAISYLHENKIIHRDLTLANLFINSNMIVKVGDFGLAVKVSDDISNRRSLCGTPNYIAPEVLNRKGHSYEVDIWALGCILYTLLTGTPPFQMDTIEETYKLISKCQYSLPESIKNCTASTFISCTLQKDPKNRPTIHELSNHDFLHVGFIPKRLPPSCIVMPPRTKTLLKYDRRRKPLQEINLPSQISQNDNLTDFELIEMLKNLKYKITNLLSDSIKNNTEDLQNPSLRPFVWINSWMYYSQKCAFGYRLNDNSVGSLFTDNTTLLVLPSGKNAYYYQKDGTEFFCQLEDIRTSQLNKKMIILKSYREFMFDSLKNAYEDSSDTDDVEPLSSVPILKSWVIIANVVGMYLSNGTLQLHFLCDHIKLILCPEMDSVTIINNGNQLYTYQLELLKTYGCDDLLSKKLNLTINVIEYIIDTFCKTWITTGDKI